MVMSFYDPKLNRMLEIFLVVGFVSLIAIAIAVVTLCIDIIA